MEPQQVTTEQSIISPEPVSAPVPTPPQQPSHLVPIILSAAITAIVLVGGYFLYTTYSPAKITTNPSPSPTTSMTTPTVELTSNWQEYLNTKHNFSFKYPANLLLGSYAGSQVMPWEADEFKIDGPYENIETQAGGPEYVIQVEVSKSKPTIESTSEKIIAYKEMRGKYVIFQMTDARIPKQAISAPDLVDQILSTFKFTNQSTENLPYNYYQITNNDAGKNMFLVLPEGMTNDKNIVTFNNTDYSISTRVGPGLCPMNQGDDDSCTYTDTQTPIWKTYRIWTENGNTFALNPHTGSYQGLSSEGLIIQKQKPTLPFTQKEIQAWTDIINNPIIQ